MPALGSDRVYVVDVKTDPRKPKLDKVILMLNFMLMLLSLGLYNFGPRTLALKLVTFTPGQRVLEASCFCKWELFH